MVVGRFMVVSGVALLASGCGVGSDSVHSCDGLATSVFCSIDPPRDDVEDDVGTYSLSPVSLCEVDGAERFLSDALFTFSGTVSYSPDERDIVAYEWSVVDQPDGSFPELSTRTGPTTVLEADAVGTFDVQLNVMNELGLRSDEPCVIRVRVLSD